MLVNFIDAVDVLRSGAIAVIPTDTIYGLVACADNKTAVQKIYLTKKRNPVKPCIILIDKPSRMLDFGVKDSWLSSTKQYWPGPYSLIFPTDRSDLYYLDRGTKTLAFRMPNNTSLINLIKKVGPIIAPSANPEGSLPATNIKQAKIYFGSDVNLYIDGGLLEKSTPSSIIDMRDQHKVR